MFTPPFVVFIHSRSEFPPPRAQPEPQERPNKSTPRQVTPADSRRCASWDMVRKLWENPELRRPADTHVQREKTCRVNLIPGPRGLSMIRVPIVLVFVGSILVLASIAGFAHGTGARVPDLAMPEVGAPGSGVSDGGVELVSFGDDIQPIFNKRCTSCHNGTQPRGQLDLTAPSSYSQLVNVVTSANCDAAVPGGTRVKPGDKEGSMLWRKTKPDPGRCLNPMPNGAPGLGIIAPDELDKLERWIQQGALNN
jgi:hypothetical protein